MNLNYIRALSRRHAGIERQIEAAQKAPLPDTILITSLKKIRLTYRERMKEAITQRRVSLAKAKDARFPKASARLAQMPVSQPERGV